MIANGQLGEHDKATALVDSGDANIVTLGKTTLANPDWPPRIAQATPLAGKRDFLAKWPYVLRILAPRMELEFRTSYRDPPGGATAAPADD